MLPEDLLPSDPELFDAGSVDRAILRLELLNGWRRALIDGYDHEDYALDRDTREAVIEVLSALACIGLKQDRLEVRFEDLIGQTEPTPFDTGHSKAPQRKPARHRGIVGRLRDQLRKLHRMDLIGSFSLTATMGAELGVVEAYEDRVRFRHSLIQAYPGSRYLGEALEDSGYKREAFYDPGHEFLIALVFHSRAAVRIAAAQSHQEAVATGRILGELVAHSSAAGGAARRPRRLQFLGAEPRTRKMGQTPAPRTRCSTC